MSFSEKRLEAIDLSHHLSGISRARGTSPLKGLQRYFGQPGMISLAGGLPSPSYFPFASVSSEGLVPDSFPTTAPERSSSLSWLWNMFTPKEKSITLTIPKYVTDPSELNLATALQYGMATGLPQLQRFIKDFTERVYQPGYSNATQLIHAGNTDGWSKAVITFCNPGEGVIVDEWTYPSAMASMIPLGVRPVPVSLDMQGMKPHELRNLLASWDEQDRGMPRPHVMYTVPVGENPTGMTMGLQRKKEIYQICVEYDVIIVEDDPYYFLQQGVYAPKGHRQAEESHFTDEEWLASLSPSFLKLDYQGRVVRLDSFSKTVAPGSRLGWFTCNPLFAERLERQGESSTQAPCGFGQSIITSLLLSWKFEGYIRWLRALSVQYKKRRDFFIDCMHEEFSFRLLRAEDGPWQGALVYAASHKDQSSVDEKCIGHKVIFSMVPPTSGMFIWLKVNFENHPDYTAETAKSLEMRLFTAVADAGVLFAPGWMFSAAGTDVQNEGHYRISFSNAEYEDMRKALKIFAHVTRKFFVRQSQDMQAL